MLLSSVMVVDDNEADHFICEHILKKHNPEINILKAYDGKEALDVLEKAEIVPEVIFLDINMPGMNGHEFLEAYDPIFKPNAAPVVVMLTSSAQGSDMERSKSFDAVVDYLTKPLDVDGLSEFCEKNSNIFDR